MHTLEDGWHGASQTGASGPRNWERKASRSMNRPDGASRALATTEVTRTTRAISIVRVIGRLSGIPHLKADYEPFVVRAWVISLGERGCWRICQHISAVGHGLNPFALGASRAKQHVCLLVRMNKRKFVRLRMTRFHASGIVLQVRRSTSSFFSSIACITLTSVGTRMCCPSVTELTQDQTVTTILPN